LLQNKQPIEIGRQISPLNQPIGGLQNKEKVSTEKVVSFVAEKMLVQNQAGLRSRSFYGLGLG